MRQWSVERVAREAGAQLLSSSSSPDRQALGRGETPGPSGVSIDSRERQEGKLFVGLPGARVDGGAHGAQALREGAWGALVSDRHGESALGAAREVGAGGAVLTHPDPLAGMQALAQAWGRELRSHGAKVVAVTGSTGKTSTKDILAALLGTRWRTAASPENFNTEIGLPLALLAAPAETEMLVLEMAMRGPGQIAELTAIAEPDVGVIVNVGPAHLELLGSLEAIAAAKAELIAGIRATASVVVPAGEELLTPHLRSDVEIITFGKGGDVSLSQVGEDGEVVIAHQGEEIVLRPSFSQAHNLSNLLAAVAVARALGYTPRGPLDVHFSGMRGQRLQVAGDAVLIDDCYNANPMSMRAAIDELAATAPARRVAVLGDMLELGAASEALHREIGEHAQARGVELLVTVGPLAAAMAGPFEGEIHEVSDARAAAELLPGLLQARDTVLVKGSRGVGLELLVSSVGVERR